MRYIAITLSLLTASGVLAQSRIVVSSYRVGPSGEIGDHSEETTYYLSGNAQLDSVQSMQIGYFTAWRDLRQSGAIRYDIPGVYHDPLPFALLKAGSFEAYERENVYRYDSSEIRQFNLRNESRGRESIVESQKNVRIIYGHEWNGSSYDKSSKAEVMTDATGRLVSSANDHWIENEWVRLTDSHYRRYYDETNRLTATALYLLKSQRMVLYDSQAYEYHSDGTLSLAEVLKMDGESKELQSRTRKRFTWYRFDPLATLSSETNLYIGGDDYSSMSTEIFDQATSSFILQGERRQFFDDQGRVIRREYWGNDEKLWRYQSFEFYPTGDPRRTQSVYLRIDTSIVGDEYFILYDDQDRPMLTMKCAFSSGRMSDEYHVQSYWTFTYESGPQVEQPAVKPPLRVSPNPAHSSVIISGCEPGSTIEIQSLSGVTQMIRKVEKEDLAINIESLASGAYMVRSDKRGTAMFVKR